MGKKSFLFLVAVLFILGIANYSVADKAPEGFVFVAPDVDETHYHLKDNKGSEACSAVKDAKDIQCISKEEAVKRGFTSACSACSEGEPWKGKEEKEKEEKSASSDPC